MFLSVNNHNNSEDSICITMRMRWTGKKKKIYGIFFQAFYIFLLLSIRFSLFSRRKNIVLTWLLVEDGERRIKRCRERKTKNQKKNCTNKVYYLINFRFNDFIYNTIINFLFKTSKRGEERKWWLEVNCFQTNRRTTNGKISTKLQLPERWMKVMCIKSPWES